MVPFFSLTKTLLKEGTFPFLKEPSEPPLGRTWAPNNQFKPLEIFGKFGKNWVAPITFPPTNSPTLQEGVKNHYFIDSPYLTQEVFGKRFLNPIGLGAGFDKNGEYVTATPALGFGFTEIGTVTPEPQKGNPKPRLFRLKEDMSLQNAMGFNNRGAEYMLNRLKSLYFLDYPIGINIGKNKITAQERAIDDYRYS